MNETVETPMTDELIEDRTSDDRRKLVGFIDANTGSHPVVPATPRRSGDERRHSDRRVVDIAIERERRQESRREEQRRVDARRQATGRRNRGPKMFSVEEAAQIIKGARTAKPVPCPRCKIDLALRPPVASEEQSIWTVSCMSCRCRLRIENL
jgi:hypothetical protein